MRTARYALAAIITATAATAACTAASGADRVAPQPAPVVGSQVESAAVMLPRVEAGTTSLGVAVDGAIEATHRERDRQAAEAKQAEEKAAEAKAQRQAAPKLTCEPNADARLVGNEIVNKACPGLNAAKEKAQRDYLNGYPLGGAEALEQERSANANERAPSEATQRQRIADGSVPAGGGYEPGSADYKTCQANPVADVCGG